MFRQVPGVLEVVSGYSGGFVGDPSYELVCTDTTGHAEVVQIAFDPERVGYEQLLEVFWAMHDPTQVDRQGPDQGTQYRSIILTHSEQQAALASASKAGTRSALDRPIATEIRPFEAFYPAEEYHQRYYERTGHEPYCHVLPVDVLERLGLVLR